MDLQDGCWRPVAANSSPDDQTDYPPRPMQVKWYHLIWMGFAIIFHVVDLCTDINVVLHYFKNGENGYAYATIVIILVPSFIISCVSYRIYLSDKHNYTPQKWNKKLKIRIVMHVIPLALLLRCINSLNYACKSWRAQKQNDTKGQKKYYKLMLKEDADCALLQVLECFLESAPQLVLQISFILKWVNSEKQLETGFTGYDPLISAVFSFGGLAWCLKTFKNSIRYVQEDKDNIGCIGSLFIFFWNLFIAISRISMLSAMLYISWVYTIIPMIVHWIVMTVSLLRKTTHGFCTSTESIESGKITVYEKILNNLFTSVFGVVSIFTYIPLDDGATCIPYTCYYIFCFLENLLGAVVWYLIEVTHGCRLVFTILSILPFCLGCCCMVIYYHWFHPKEHKIANGTVNVENGQGDAGNEMQEISLHEKL